MSYIAPNSDLYILKQVPFEKNHLHTARFTSKQNQETTLMSYCKTGYDFHHISYQRSGEKSIRISALADNLYDCNYMMFRNTAFGNKWFYAFIDEVKYINNNTSEILYTIDVIQTWLFDFEVEDCYIEREHTQTDEKYAHTITENFNVKASKVIKRQIVNYSGNKTTLLFYYVPNIIWGDDSTQSYIIKELTNQIVDGYYKVDYYPSELTAYTGFYNHGSYLGCCVFPIEVNTTVNNPERNDEILKIISIVRAIVTSSGKLIAIKAYPSGIKNNFLSNDIETSQHNFLLSDEFIGKNETYKPKNNKLLNYPFMTVSITNNDGNSKTFLPQYFASNVGAIAFESAVSTLPTYDMQVYPLNYNDLNKDFQNSLPIDLENENSWNEDSYALYYAQQKNADDLRMLGQIVASALTLVGAVASAIVTDGATLPFAIAAYGSGAGGMISAGMQDIANSVHAKDAQDNYQGSYTGNDIAIAQYRYGFTIYQNGIDIATAKNIDNYFSCYGYAVKKVKKPNLYTSGAHLRLNWNFLKTRDCHIKPINEGINYNDIDEIENIFNNGITFWNVESIGMSYIGDYTHFDYDNPTT